MLTATGWTDFELIDCGDGEKLERWGEYLLVRPDPQAIWPRQAPARWREADAVYHRSASGGGEWETRRVLPEAWTVRRGALSFLVRPTGFKHTGLFPEQAVNWDWLGRQVQQGGAPVSMLNLFAYTGGATVAAAAAGATVAHVDAAKGMVRWAGENLAESGLAERPVRFLVDDVFKFVEREARRGRRYDGIVMDPPSYGRGTQGETWKIEKDLWRLLESCRAVLAERPRFFLLNSYTAGFSPTVLANLLEALLVPAYGGTVESGEVGLAATASKLVLPCGIFARWTA